MQFIGLQTDKLQFTSFPKKPKREHSHSAVFSLLIGMKNPIEDQLFLCLSLWWVFSTRAVLPSGFSVMSPARVNAHLVIMGPKIS